MKCTSLLLVSIVFLIGSAQLHDTENEMMVKALAADIVNELELPKRPRNARHMQVVTETTIDHFLNNLREKYEKHNMSSKWGLNRAIYELRKKMKILRQRLQKKKNKKRFNNTANKTAHAP